MNFEIKCDSMLETVLKNKPSKKEEGCFASVFYDSYENRLKREVTQEITSTAVAKQPQKMSFGERMKLKRQLNSTIVSKVDEILKNENHHSHVTWSKTVTVKYEKYSDEDWKILSDYRYNWDRRDLERERMEIKMKMKEILSEIVSSIV